MRTIRLLTIGNSFADNALTYLEPIADSGGRVRFDVGRANLGGCSLEKHWNLAEYSAQHPEYKTYTLGRTPDGEPIQANLQDALRARPWDVVTLQQVSHRSWRAATFEPYLGRLIAQVRELAPQASILLHQTWAYRSDSPFLPENGLTQESMHQRIRNAYRQYAASYGCGLLPSGEAIRSARMTPGHTFRWPEEDCGYRLAAAPSLPKQEHSLAVGWYWAIRETGDGVPELRLDANHLNARGNYLVGCVWYETIAEDPTGADPFVPACLDAADAAFLRRLAHETVAP
ncbi:MAG: DUF4886 domain-containing protein [Lentisphaeria bacterium]|nr:DUF4886 domain-containing protein [Lentisphaeria bacterium]